MFGLEPTFGATERFSFSVQKATKVSLQTFHIRYRWVCVQCEHQIIDYVQRKYKLVKRRELSLPVAIIGENMRLVFDIGQILFQCFLI